MIFVTGGTGLIGTHLLYELTKKGKKVRALKRAASNLQQVKKTFSFYTENVDKLFDTIEWVNGDILDYYTLEPLLAGITEIYHCAAVVSFSKKERQQMINNNVEGTANLVDAALINGVKKICHVSSIAALGALQNGEPVSEETNWTPSKKNSAYSDSKFHSETEIWRGIEEGMEGVIVNPSIIFGPGNWESSSSKIFKTIWKGMKFYTRGTTGFVDVKDVVRAMLLLMEPENFENGKNQRYLLNAENLSYQDVFNQIADALNKPRPSVFASDFMSGIAWRAAAVTSFFTGTPAIITREIATGRNEIHNYDGSKITRIPDFNYTPIADSIRFSASCFLNDNK
ncbi:MAG: NAD-dependent epimerase/dehydratase family protein [Draconibacterium sp.]